MLENKKECTLKIKCLTKAHLFQGWNCQLSYTLPEQPPLPRVNTRWSRLGRRKPAWPFLLQSNIVCRAAWRLLKGPLEWSLSPKQKSKGCIKFFLGRNRKLLGRAGIQECKKMSWRKSSSRCPRHLSCDAHWNTPRGMCCNR